MGSGQWGLDTSQTIVIINDGKTHNKAVKLSGTGLASLFSVYVTSATDDCKDFGTINTGELILIPANAVVTLYKKN